MADETMRLLERAAATGDALAVARLEAAKARRVERAPVAVRFMKHYVTDGTRKVRVTYSAGECYVYAEGRVVGTRPAVTLYAKDYEEALPALFPAEYENKSDSMTDYFEHGNVRFFEGHPLYAAALKRAEANKADDAKRHEARMARWEAKRQERLAAHRAESAKVSAFIRGVAS